MNKYVVYLQSHTSHMVFIKNPQDAREKVAKFHGKLAKLLLLEEGMRRFLLYQIKVVKWWICNNTFCNLVKKIIYIF